MKLSSWVIAIYCTGGIVFLIKAFWNSYGFDNVFTPAALIFAAAYCMLFAFLVKLSRGIQQPIMLVAAITIFFFYVLRLLVLSFDKNMFTFSDLNVLSSTSVMKAIGFMMISTIAFWYGTYLSSLSTHSESHKITHRTYRSRKFILFKHRYILILTGLTTIIILFTLQYKAGITLPNEITDQYGYLSRFLPVDAFAYLLMFIMVYYWKDISWGNKVSCFIFFGLSFLVQFQVGSRSALFSAAMIWFLTMIWKQHDPKISYNLIFIGSLGLVLVLSTFLNIVMTVREAVYSTQATASFAVLYSGMSGTLDLAQSFLMVSNRLGSMDWLLAVMNYQPPDVKSYLTLANLFKSLIGGLIPNFIWSSDVPALGKFFGVIYQGLPWDARHHGSWSGFGIFYAFYGWFGFLIIGCWGFIMGTVLMKLNKLQYKDERYGWLAPYLMDGGIYAIFISGNFDTIISGYFSQIIIGIAVMLALTVPIKCCRVRLIKKKVISDKGLNIISSNR